MTALGPSVQAAPFLETANPDPNAPLGPLASMNRTTAPGDSVGTTGAVETGGGADCGGVGGTGVWPLNRSQANVESPKTTARVAHFCHEIPDRITFMNERLAEVSRKDRPNF